MSDAAAISTADEYKQKGNDYFKDGHYEQSIEFYTKAIDLNESAVFYANRSFSYIKTEAFGYALEDANKAISLDPKYAKGYYRRASANMALGKYQLALRDFEAVTTACPNDSGARQKFLACQKLVNIIRFQKAIAVSDKPSSLQVLKYSHIVVEDSYAGPHMLSVAVENNENGVVTSEVENQKGRSKQKSQGDGQSIGLHSNDDITERSGITLSFMEDLLVHFKNQKNLHRKYCLQIIKNSADYFDTLESLVDIDIPNGNKFTVCGDIHGQFYDLLNIFEINGKPSENNPYLFNGDFVDRGAFSVECIFTLLGYKLLYPNHFFLARGNHESENMNQLYGFDSEATEKCGKEFVELFCELFNRLPLCHLINKRILCMHGGLFNDEGVKLSQLRSISRKRQPPTEGHMCELLWSDPGPMKGRSASKRGIGITFGPDVTKSFCELNDLDYIVRSHEVKDMGYEVDHDGRCITVFSAPNYCDTIGNKGAFMKITCSHEKGAMKPQFVSFKEVPHPKVRSFAMSGGLMSLFS